MAKAYDKMKVLKYIFDKKTNNGTCKIGTDIDFTLKEIGEGITATGGNAPTSWSNFVLDLTRKKNSIGQRLPDYIIKYGYDLRKKTGKVPGNTGDNYCGTFVYRGFDEYGQTIPIQDWLEWGVPDREITVENKVPELVRRFISNDEASLFSVIDYCNILSIVLEQDVYRVQSPMKWQPNEIDGYYIAQTSRNIIVYPVEAKASSTSDDINLAQINSQYNVFIEKYKRNNFSLIVHPIAVKMEKDGMLLAVMEHNPMYDPVQNGHANMFNIVNIVKVKLDPPLLAWNNVGSKKTAFIYHPPTRSTCKMCEQLLKTNTAKPIIDTYEGRASSANGYPFHEWYNFVLGYTPTFPEYILRKEGVTAGDGKIILDPFVGSGTTQLVCKLNGIPSYGIDANDFMVFAANQKLNWNIDFVTVQTVLDDVIAEYEEKSRQFDWTDRVFLHKKANENRPKALDERYISDKPLVKVLLLREAVEKMQLTDEYHDLFMFAISAILVPVSNVKYGPGFGVGKIKEDVNVLDFFKEKVHLMIRDLSSVSDWQKATPSVTLLGDSRHLSEYIEQDSISLIITSPPYPGDHEYTKHSKLELIFNGYATDLASFRTIKKRMIRGSTTNIYKEDNDKTFIEDIPAIQEITDVITARLQNDGATSGFEKLYTKLVWEYYGGMAYTLSECYKVLKKGGKIALLISDSHAFKMVHIQTAELLKLVG